MISNLDGLATAIKEMDKVEFIGKAIEDFDGYKFLMSSSPMALNTLTKEQLDLLEEIEHSAGFYLLTSEGLTVKAAIKRLGDVGLRVAQLHDENEYFSHVIHAENFDIPFSA